MQNSQHPQHKRVYQACIPCRRRKVKCDLGSVDNPGDPPCVRCRRESKECFFSATRRKRKNEDGKEDSLDGYEFGDDYIVRNGRKMHGSPPAPASGAMRAPVSARSAAPYEAPPIPGPPLTPGGSIGRTQPLRRPQQNADESVRYDRNSEEANTQLENLEAQEVMRKEMYGPHDALDLLYKAATDSPGHKRSGRESSSQLSPMLGNMSRDQHQPSPMRSNIQPFPTNHMRPPEIPQDTTSIDPALSDPKADRTRDPGYKEAIKAWSRFRFVRAGWFTPVEAIDYID